MPMQPSFVHIDVLRNKCKHQIHSMKFDLSNDNDFFLIYCYEKKKKKEDPQSLIMMDDPLFLRRVFFYDDYRSTACQHQIALVCLLRRRLFFCQIDHSLSPRILFFFFFVFSSLYRDIRLDRADIERKYRTRQCSLVQCQ